MPITAARPRHSIGLRVIGLFAAKLFRTARAQALALDKYGSEQTQAGFSDTIDRFNV